MVVKIRPMSKRQEEILACIAGALDDQGYPPTIREIGNAVGITSTSVVNYHLNKLRDRGLLDRDDRVSRGLKLTTAADRLLKRGKKAARRAAAAPAPAPAPAAAGATTGARQPLPFPARAVADVSSLIRVPVMGKIAAGTGIPDMHDFDPDEFVGDFLRVGRELVGGREPVFALEVKGDSMIDALVHDGDIVVVEPASRADNGEMVAAWIKDREETTLKRFFDEGERIRLQPANPTMGPMFFPPDGIEIQGRVVAVIRSLTRPAFAGA